MSRVGGRLNQHHQRDYTPVHWSEYFDEAHDLPIDSRDEISSNESNSFRIYLKNFCEPYAPNERDADQKELSAAQLAEYSRWPTVVTLHGGGYSGLTWSLFTYHLTRLCQCRVMSIDLRAHGDTKTDNDDQMNAETLVGDIVEVVQAGHRLCGFPEPPRLVLVGHSMGGALAIKLAAEAEESLPSVLGLVVIDVVEGTAKDALPLMLSVIKTRPVCFPTLTNAIEWSVRSGMAKSSDAARVSMPGNLINIANGQLAVHEAAPVNANRVATSPLKRHTFSVKLEQLLSSSNPSTNLRSLSQRPPLPHTRVATLREEDSLALKKSLATDEEPSLDERPPEESTELDTPEVTTTLDKDGYRKPHDLDRQTGYTWRTDLARTQPHWAGWFEGLSSQMLNANVQGKFLLLAGIDRLDKTLTIGQMQGKFMMKVLPKCGHAVHEDLPEQVAMAIADFLVRNKFTTLVAAD